MNTRGKTRPPARACSLCGLVGHNKTTCQKKAPAGAGKPSSAAVKFFIHHVDFRDHASAHRLDLSKKRQALWQAVDTETSAAAPSLYHQYHEQTSVLFEPADAPALREKLTPDHARATTPINFNQRAAKNHHKKITEIKFAARQTISRLRTAARQAALTLPVKKITFAAATLVIILILPFQARSEYQNARLSFTQMSQAGVNGFASLKTAADNLAAADLNGAETSLYAALQNFNTLAATLSDYYWLSALAQHLPLVGKTIQSRANLVLAGQEMALANVYLINGLKQTQTTDKKLTERLKTLGAEWQLAAPHYQNARRYLDDVDPASLPAAYQEQLGQLKILLAALAGDTDHLSSLSGALNEIFGGAGRRRYLMVFQNENELRPTGGFAGSFALLDIKDGELINFDLPAGGSYDLQGQLTAFVEPPTPLLLIKKRWEFQDANWFPDFPASAEKMTWFFNKSRNLTVDGVIAVNGSVLTRLLSVLGPVGDEKRGLTLAADNALTDIQTVVETGAEKTAGKPKQILSDLSATLLSEVKKLSSDRLWPLLASVYEALNQKEIQVYFTDKSAQATAESFGWSGQITPTKPGQDYLMVVNTNIYGEKSDAKIKQQIEHEAVMQTDGSVVNTVTITRTHTGAAGEQFYGQTNIDYLRLYVPAGSELISAGGAIWPDEKYFKTPEPWYEKDAALLALEKTTGVDALSGTRVTREFGKTAFGNWLIVEPGQTARLQFVYRLPFKLTSAPPAVTTLAAWKNFFHAKQSISYQLLVQKQSGITSDFESQIIFTDDFKPVWQAGQNAALAANGLVIANQPLITDRVFGVLAQTAP